MGGGVFSATIDPAVIGILLLFFRNGGVNLLLLLYKCQVTYARHNSTRRRTLMLYTIYFRSEIVHPTGSGVRSLNKMIHNQVLL
jgi:hypothetical protein